jgi:hypothetical protein
MSQDNPEETLKDKLNATSKKLSELSKKAAIATKEAMESATKTTKSVVGKASDSIQNAVVEGKEKRIAKKEEKIQKTKDELTSDGMMDDTPAMIILPQFEAETLEITNEQNEHMIEIVENMHRLSLRIDGIDKKIKSSNHSSMTTTRSSAIKQFSTDEDGENTLRELVGTSEAITQVLHLLGATLLWVIALFGMDKYSESLELLIAGTYPVSFAIWGLGSTSWMMYVLYRLSKAGSLLDLRMSTRIQFSLALGIFTCLGLLLNEDSMTTVSNVWIWGTIIASGILLGASMIASAWRGTKRLVSVRETIEIID